MDFLPIENTSIRFMGAYICTYLSLLSLRGLKEVSGKTDTGIQQLDRMLSISQYTNLKKSLNTRAYYSTAEFMKEDNYSSF